MWSTCHKPNTDLLMAMWKCSENSHSMMCTYLDKKAISTSHVLLSRTFYLHWSVTYQKLEAALASVHSTPSTKQSNWPLQGIQVQCCVCPIKNKLDRSSDASNKDVLFCWSLIQYSQQHFLRVKMDHTNTRKNFAIPLHYFYSMKVLMK